MHSSDEKDVLSLKLMRERSAGIVENLPPNKSRLVYIKAYDEFCKWKNENQTSAEVNRMLKTYSRKRQENKLLEDVFGLCRLCLARSEEMVPIFERADNVCSALPMRIMICLGYEITQEDCLPNTICTNCQKELEQYYKFRKKCEDSYLKLKSHLKATMCKDRINEVLLEQKLNGDEVKVTACELYRSTCEMYRSTNEPYSSVNKSYRSTSEPCKSTSEPYRSPSELCKSTSEPYRSPSEPCKSTSEPCRSTSELCKATSETYRSTSEPCKSTSEPYRSPSELCKSTSEPYRSTSEPYKSTSEPCKSTSEPYRSTSEPCKSIGEPNGTTCDLYGPTSEPNRSQKIQEDLKVVQLVTADVCNIDEQEIPIMANSLKLMPETDVNVEETTEIQFIEQNSEVNPDISTFLNAILVELGILVKNDGGLVVQDQGVTSFELETGDDDQLVFELVEEDETEEPPIAFVMPEPHSKYQEMPKSKLVKKNKKGGARKKNAVQKTGAWCGVCGRGFASRSAARRHAAVHSGARPHACPDCGRAFAQKVVMERHRLLHREKRPHQCGQCAKSFTQRGALEAHTRAHAASPARALTLHACAHCDRVFLYSSGLSRHMMTHSGRMFACGTCDRLFNDRSSLLRHVRNAHPLNPQPLPSK